MKTRTFIQKMCFGAHGGQELLSCSAHLSLLIIRKKEDKVGLKKTQIIRPLIMWIL